MTRATTHGRRGTAFSFILLFGSITWLIVYADCLPAAAESAIQTQQKPTPSPTPTPDGPAGYKDLSIEELMNVEVTSVSRHPEKLSESASAIQVITREDIQRSGATRLPEALRLAFNLEVDQVDSIQWAISARGFNTPLANKLLVLIDGRTVYSPLFAGVFWDGQDVLLEDVNRIEVISGPGGTLWGANAVNGVINITTRNSKDTQGLFLEGGVGSELRDFASIRYGGKIASDAFYRVYGKVSNRDSSILPNGEDGNNPWRTAQGGFRVDWGNHGADAFTVQGDAYESRTTFTSTDQSSAKGANVLGRWTRNISESSDFRLQMYFDRVHRDIPGSYDDTLNTFDVDFQHRFPLGARHDIVWGGGYRLARDNFQPRGLILDPPRLSEQTFSTFIQDEIALIKDRVQLTLGTKIEHDHYSGIEFQPSARVAWKLSGRQTLWTAVSRAVRTPSRIDRDLVVPPLTAGGPNFESEQLTAYELGYRAQVNDRLTLSLSTYYNKYDDLRSIQTANPLVPIPLIIVNGQKGESYGGELAADVRFTNRFRLRAGYNESRVHIGPEAGSPDLSFGSGEAADSNHRLFLQPYLDLPGHLQFDTSFRYISSITNPVQQVPGYTELDLRLAWQPFRKITFAAIGQNLLHSHHLEFGAPGSRQEIQRSVYGTIKWGF